MTPPNIYGMSENFFGKWTKIDHSQENLHKSLHDFTSVSFEAGEELLPIENVKLLAYDRFFNLSELTLETVPVKDHELLSAVLKQNFPNPFTTSTIISFVLQKPGITKLYVRDMNGRIIKTLVNDNLTSGNHEVTMNGNLPAGSYLYTLVCDGKRTTKRMIKRN